MTKAVAFLSAALLAATLGVAQDTSTSGTASSQSSSPATGQNSTVQGCLSSTSDTNFTLTQDQTGMVFTLSGSADQLKAHVGHEVAITGQQASGSAASSTTPDNSAASSTSSNASGNTIQVSDVKMIADHCNAAGAAPSGAAASTTPDASANTSAAAAPSSTSSNMAA